MIWKLAVAALSILVGCGASQAENAAPTRLAIGMTEADAKIALGGYPWKPAPGTAERGETFDGYGGFWSAPAPVGPIEVVQKGRPIAVLPAGELEVNVTGQWVRKLRVDFVGDDVVAQARAFAKTIAWKEDVPTKPKLVELRDTFLTGALECASNAPSGAVSWNHPSGLVLLASIECRNKAPFAFVEIGVDYYKLKTFKPEDFR